MKIEIINLPDELREGLIRLQDDYNFELAGGGICLSAQPTEQQTLTVERHGCNASIRYRLPVHFFRGLSLLLQQEEKDFCIVQPAKFDSIGVMLDVSQSGALPRPETLFALLRRMAVMGLNRLVLYMEDSYLLAQRPFWGYLRGKYTQEELRAIDDYAYKLGVEVVPAIQTLSHLGDVLKWDAFADVRENDATLLPEEPKTEQLIREMFAALKGCFHSNRVHIGMDEAWGLGEGAYCQRHGGKIVPKETIMNTHLQTVCRIADEFGVQPMLWSDMFFRGSYESTAVYGNDFYLHAQITQQMIDAYPKQAQMVFWEYNSTDSEFYRRAIEQHCKFGAPPAFAGAIWNWTGFGVNYGLTTQSTNAAMKACRETGLREVFATLWGDDNTECPWSAALAGLQLFAEHGYCDDTPDAETLSHRFSVCCHGCYEDFIRIGQLAETPGVTTGNSEMANPDKFLLWQNILRGSYDRNIRGLQLAEHYHQLAIFMQEAVNRNPWYQELFALYEQLCSVLELKAEMGLRLFDSYHAHDTDQLQRCRLDLRELDRRCEQLRLLHRAQWYRTNSGSGWEVLGLRYGALQENVQTAIYRVEQYLCGDVARLEELEEERQFFNAEPGLPAIYTYRWMPTASRLFLN